MEKAAGSLAGICTGEDKLDTHIWEKINTAEAELESLESNSLKQLWILLFIVVLKNFYKYSPRIPQFVPQKWYIDYSSSV